MTFYYRFESEIRPVTPLRLKVEINTREHFSVLGLRRMRFTLDNPWHSGAAEALTHLTSLDADKIVECFTRYMEHDGHRVTQTQFERNLAEKMRDEAFPGDVPSPLAVGVSFDPIAAFRRVQDVLISRLPEGAARKRQRRRQ